MIKASVVGASGYSGIYLPYALSLREDVELSFLTSQTYSGKKLAEVFPSFSGQPKNGGISGLPFSAFDEAAVAESSDVVFFCLPHGESSKLVSGLLKKNGKIKIIDVGADFRFDALAAYEKFYGPHNAPELNQNFVYGLADVFGDKIKNSQFAANPGCYPTGALLPLLPLVFKGVLDSGFPVIIDSLSGISGSGRSLKLQNLFCEVENSARAYNAWSHRHLPEIREKITGALAASAGLPDDKSAGLNVNVIFTPHVIPTPRGILTTIYIRLKEDLPDSVISGIFGEFYAGSPFVSLMGNIEDCNIKSVIYSNNCHIAFEAGGGENGRMVKIVSAIDNIGKGASLQAVQNMNVRFGFPETHGLRAYGEL